MADKATKKANAAGQLEPHDKWKETRCFTKYRCLTGLLNDGLILENIDQWTDETSWFIKDMKHLLSLEYCKFWSTIAYNQTARDSVLSFLQNAVPNYLLPLFKSFENERAFKLYADARLYVFKVICRFTQMRENEEAWMKIDTFSYLVYSSSIMTVPCMFDIIAIYGQDNSEKVSAIIELMLKIQQKYTLDFKEGFGYLLIAFNIIQDRCKWELTDRVPLAALNDLALYVRDCVYTLHVAVEISPTLRNMCSELNYEFAVSDFYENAVLVLYKKIQKMDETSSYLQMLNDSRVELLNTFRSIITVQLDKVLSAIGDTILAGDTLLNILTECLTNSDFVIDYKRQYDIGTDLQIIQSRCKLVDMIKLSFIEKAYTEMEDETTNKCMVESVAGAAGDFAQVFDDSDAHPDPAGATNAPNGAVSEQQKQTKVETIMELLPHLDVEKIRDIVDRYDSTEEAVAVLLEQSDPPDGPSICQVDEALNIPTDALDEFYMKTGINRLNIYDGDEFDVMVNDNVKGIIKKGKGMPGEPKTLNELLDDKSHVQQVRHIYQRYDTLAILDPDDDEYDDSYEAMAESESRHMKVAKGIRKVLVDDGQDNDSESEKDSDSVPDPDTIRNRALAFCENPEITRKRREERLNSKYQHRHGTVPPNEKDGKGGDVRGNPKGQGQNAKVLQNRKTKNENKASAGNHNRKQGASYKRNRGMMPS